MRAYATANTAHSIPNDNHSDLQGTSSIMIKKSYRKFTTFPMGDYSVLFMEDFLSNKDSSDEIIEQSPVGNIANLRYKICRHRLYTGYKGCRIIGVSGFRHKRRTRPFSVYEECAQLIIYFSATRSCCQFRKSKNVARNITTSYRQACMIKLRQTRVLVTGERYLMFPYPVI